MKYSFHKLILNIQVLPIQILQVLTLIQSEGKMLDKSGVQKWTTSLERLTEYYFSKFTLFAIEELNCLLSLSKLQQFYLVCQRQKDSLHINDKV